MVSKAFTPLSYEFVTHLASGSWHHPSKHLSPRRTVAAKETLLYQAHILGIMFVLGGGLRTEVRIGDRTRRGKMSERNG